MIGIIDYEEDIWVQVLWDEPRIGYSDLGGRCLPMRGEMVRFVEVYNLSGKWFNYVESRSEGKKEGWDYKTKLFIPEFE